MGGSLQKHDWLQNKIYNHPELVGIPASSILLKAKEYELIWDGHTLTIPDVYFRIPEVAHFYEIKSGNNPALYNKGMNQLEKIVMWSERHGLKNFEAKMIMPARNSDQLWIEMLKDLEFYSLGDSYRALK